MGAVASIEQEFTATARVVAIAQQKPGRKTVGVKVATDDGDEVWLNVYADKASDLSKGERYEFKYKGDGKYVSSYKHITPHGHQARAADNQQPHQNGKKMDYWEPKPRAPKEQKQIWVACFLGREVEKYNGFMSKETATTRGRHWCEVWEDLFGNDANPAD